MPLPETIAMRFTEEDAGYISVRPVLRQVFRLTELVDMVLSVTGKNALRVQQIFRAGTVVYNGFRYSWEGFATETDELADLLAPFPDDDPSRSFNATAVTTVFLEIAGGAQRSLIAITRQEASARRLFQKRNPWEILLGVTQESAPRYEKYSHAQRGDVYRLHLSTEAALALRNELLGAAPRTIRKKFAGLQPPSALSFLIPRAAHAAGPGSPP
jgi:hypothetical protein